MAKFGDGGELLKCSFCGKSQKTGLSLGTTGNGWSHPTYTVSPGIPGDSGSALLGPNGQAAGVLSTLALAPLAGSNNYADLASAIAYMHSHGGPQATVANGTEPFDGSRLPLGL